MPLNTRRLFPRGTLRGLFGRSGLMAAHSSKFVARGFESPVGSLDHAPGNIISPQGPTGQIVCGGRRATRQFITLLGGAAGLTVPSPDEVIERRSPMNPLPARSCQFELPLSGRCLASRN